MNINHKSFKKYYNDELDKFVKLSRMNKVNYETFKTNKCDKVILICTTYLWKRFSLNTEFYKFLFQFHYSIQHTDDRGGKRLAHRCSLVRPRSIGSRGKNIWARLHDKQKVLAARKRECHASDLVRPRVTGKNEFSSWNSVMTNVRHRAFD